MPTKTKKKTTPMTEKFVDKHPNIRKMFNKLQEDKKALQAKSAPLREKREALVAKIQPLEAELRTVDATIAKIERPKMGEIDMELSALAKAMGGRSMSQSVEPEPKE